MVCHHEIINVEPVFGIIVPSDSRFKRLIEEGVYDIGESGNYAVNYLRSKNYRTLHPILIPNHKEMIKSAIEYLIDTANVNTVITIGGTGVSKRDVSVDAVLEISNKILDGFGELFRRYSETEIGPNTILSRACAGIYKDKAVIFAVPGSLDAVKLAIEKIIEPTIRHILSELFR